MKKLGYILLTVVVFLSFTPENVFAGEVNKAKEAEIEFAKTVAQDSDSELNIDAKTVSDDELKNVVGKVNKLGYDGGRATRIIKEGIDKTVQVTKSKTSGVGLNPNGGEIHYGTGFSYSEIYKVGKIIEHYEGYDIITVYYTGGRFIKYKVATKNTNWSKF